MNPNDTPEITRPAWLTVALDAITANIAATRSFVGPRAGVMAVVKANAYGHGLVPAATAALAGGAEWLGVAIPEEALALRDAGIAARVLVMGASDPSTAAALVRAGIDAVVSTDELLAALSAEASRQGRPARVHVKVDTGMGRVGVSPEDAPRFLRQAAASPGVEWVGMMTHFATADEPDLTFAREQWQKFRSLFPAAMALRAPGSEPLVVHAANSAAVCALPETWGDLPGGLAPLVRCGLLAYGIPPIPSGPMPALRPALSLKARVTQAKNVPAGTAVSYGATFRTTRPSRLALIPLGYADGYGRANSNRAEVLLHGRRVPVAGRVCMDQFVVDATETGAEVGDEVVLLGRQADEEITVNELAAWGDTVHHEVLARLGARLPRMYEPIG
jgi:alanine racemase